MTCTSHRTEKDFGSPTVKESMVFLNDLNLNHYQDGLLSQLRWLRCHFWLSSPFAWIIFSSSQSKRMKSENLNKPFLVDFRIEK